MAKKKVKPTKDESLPHKTIQSDGKTVSISMGLKLSPSYNSVHYDIGLSTDVLVGESEADALARVDKIVSEYFHNVHEQRFEQLFESMDRCKQLEKSRDR